MKTEPYLREDSAARMRRLQQEQRARIWQIGWVGLGLVGFLGLWASHK